MKTKIGPQAKSKIGSRQATIIKTSIIGILVNLVLVGFKIFVGLVSNSIAIVLDAVNNLTDAVSSIVTIVGAALAGKRPDKKHPYGYGRLEYFSTVIVAAMVLFAGLTAGREAIEKIISPEVAEYSTVSLVIIGVAVVVKFLLGRHFIATGRKVNSGTLVASGKDATMDGFLSLSTLVGMVLSVSFGWQLEGYLGLVISIFILKAGIEMLGETLATIIGERADPETTKKIRQELMKFSEVQGVYDLTLHNYGPSKVIATAHVQLRDDMTASEIHALTREMTYACFEKFGVILTVGIYAANDSRRYTGLRKDVLSLVERYPEILQVHGFYVDRDENVYFDLVFDFACDDPEKVKNKIVADLAAKYPGHNYNVIVDADVSDL